MTCGGQSWRVLSAFAKKRRAALALRRWVSRKSTVLPCLSTARNSHFHSPFTRMHVLVDPPGAAGVALVPADLLLQPRGVVLNPPPDGRVIDRDAAFRHHLLELTIANGIFAVPADALQDDEGME